MSLPEYTGDVDVLTDGYERRLLAAFPAAAAGEQRFSPQRSGVSDRASSHQRAYAWQPCGARAPARLPVDWRGGAYA